jgi:N-acetylglutamate synthase-like GNAT family acetyltransferase
MASMHKSTEGITLRRARADDQPIIRAMVRRAGLNPINVRWPNFWVAEAAMDAQQLIVGVAQLRPHANGIRELASLAVAPEWQHRGIGAQLTRQLLDGQRGPIYLFCQSGLAGYYARFGFHLVTRRELPAPLARMHRLVGVLVWMEARLGHHPEPIVPMRWV